MKTMSRELRIRQEMANSLIRGFGIVFGVICIPILITQGVKNGSSKGTVGTAIFGFTFLMLFTFSTLYHGLQQERIKTLMNIFDQISVYFLIAGTRSSLFASMPLSVIALTLTSAGLYTLGASFYIGEKHVYSHAVWHSFVLAAAICHYVAILVAV